MNIHQNSTETDIHHIPEPPKETARRLLADMKSKNYSKIS